MSSDIETLKAESEMNRLVSRYSTIVDWMDWDRLPDIFATDADIDFGQMFTGDLAGFTPFVSALEAGYDRRMHMFGLPRLDVTAQSGRAECTNISFTRTKGSENNDDSIIFGRYIFEGKPIDGAWKLTRLKFMLNAMHASQQPVADESMLNTCDGMQPGHPDKPSA
ncbi:hypothetical protein GCM10011371_00250 [Novosphingobium marinum]|uniref:SnoaL-like domain-containing protein n=1 Tax=Novosphingobium marinum TaxID=1514948 RepID=A0A7Y9XSL8_9SPHN|nr:nuclear transport factor 2 family protein [Novosphingobium marinum]NYH93717.1 hypothetical protein [Novosphingobium marinum]GGC16778.1 hypothetical protein GCM10011371_00250 [Novosphingobium marinum]